MTYKNPRQLLDAATALPAAIEGKLPAGAPKISTKLLDFDNKVVSKLPDFIVEIPELPAVPELPAGPTGLRRFVTGVEVRPLPARRAEAPAPKEEVKKASSGLITPYFQH